MAGGLRFQLEQVLWKYIRELFDSVGLVTVCDEDGVVCFYDDEIVNTKKCDVCVA